MVVAAVGGGGGSPVSLVSAFVFAGRTLEAGFFLNLAWGCIGMAIWVGGWIAQFIIGWLLWKLLMCGHQQGFYSDHNKTESHSHFPHLHNGTSEKKKDDGGFQVIVDDGQRKPINTPIWSALDSKGIPRLLSRQAAAAKKIGQETPSLQQQPHPLAYKNVVIPFIPDKKQWHGHGRSLYESYVRLVILILRLSIVLFATAIAFSVAGVNFYSLVTGLGIVSVSFSYAASGMLSNVFGALYMYSTTKLELHDYVSVGPINGEVTAFRAQWTELTDDSQPWKGRMIHQLPNRLPMETIVTIYPNGPGLSVLKSVKDDLAAIDAWVASNPLALEQLQSQYFVNAKTQ